MTDVQYFGLLTVVWVSPIPGQSWWVNVLAGFACLFLATLSAIKKN